MASQTNGAGAYGEVVWSWRPDAGVKLARSISPMTVAKEPVTGEITKETVKTIARGMSGDPDVTVVTTLVCFFTLHARLRAHRAPGIPCALCLQRDMLMQSRARRAAATRSRICLNASRE